MILNADCIISNQSVIALCVLTSSNSPRYDPTEANRKMGWPSFCIDNQRYNHCLAVKESDKDGLTMIKAWCRYPSTSLRRYFIDFKDNLKWQRLADINWRSRVLKYIGVGDIKISESPAFPNLSELLLELTRALNRNIISWPLHLYSV